MSLLSMKQLGDKHKSTACENFPLSVERWSMPGTALRTLFVISQRISEVRPLTRVEQALYAIMIESMLSETQPLGPDLAQALKERQRKPALVPYSCPVCGSADRTSYLRCNRPDCTDGRDPR